MVIPLSLLIALIGHALLGYIVLAQALRFRRATAADKFWKTKYPTRASLCRMTADDAFKILLPLQQLEMPLAFEIGNAGALYRPLGIQSISRVVLATRQFADVETGGKRVADTSVFIADLVQHDPGSERVCGAIARINYIHDRYQRSGMIWDADLLYTLALLAWLPVWFIQRFEWRQLTSIELCAVGVFWKSIGDGMKLSYNGLEFTNPDDDSWPVGSVHSGDGLRFMEELRVFCERYEAECLKPHEDNREAALQTTRVLLNNMPSVLTGVSQTFLAALMDDRLREAVMVPKPPAWLGSAVVLFMNIRRFVLRHACLPRYSPALRVTKHADAQGRYHRLSWPLAAAPWYVSATFSTRWGVRAWLEWWSRHPIPGDASMQPQGYTQEDLGPAQFRGNDSEFVKDETARLLNARRGGCPFG